MTLVRRVAALAALSVASAGLVGVAAQPASAADDATFTWSFSDYLANPQGLPVGFSEHAASDGATSAGSDVVFSGGTGTGSLATGDLHLAYQGTVTYTWHMEISFSDPEVIVEHGDGRIVADVAWALPETGSAEDVVLTTFDPATVTVDGNAFSTTPRWAGVGAEGRSQWAQEFLDALPDSTDAFFHATGSSSDARKAPARFTSAATATAAPAVALETSYDGNSLVVGINGTNFAPVNNPPREDGIYVALAPSGSFPETDDLEDQDKVAATDWVRQAQIVDGAFSVSLSPKNSRLDPSKKYSLYTWQAHLHSNDASNTETPVAIDWSKLGAASKLKVTTKARKLVVKNANAAGKVTVKLTKGKTSKTAKATMKKGRATVKLPKLTKGTWKAKVTFVPSTADYRAATKTVKVKKK